MKRLLFVFVLILIFCLSCTDNSKIAVPVVTEVVVIEPVSTTSSAPLSEVPMMVTEVVTTPVVNPYSGKIWNQYCDQVKKDGMIVDINCNEKWALEPLPGGCETKILNYKGYSGCTAASLSYVINKLMSAEEINAVLGGDIYGVTPSYLIDYVFQNMERKVRLNCNGTSVETLRLTLSYFGLQVRTASVSKGTLADKVIPGELALVGVSGKFEGSEIEHWTVFADEREEGLEFADSFIGKGSLTVFDKVEELSWWEIISALFVSKTSP